MGCITQNTKFLLNTLRVLQPTIQNFFEKNLHIAGCRTRNVFKKSFILRVVQPAM